MQSIMPYRNKARGLLQRFDHAKAFFVTAFLFGLLFLFAVPPYQSPDEPNHYHRVRHISLGNFFYERDGDVVGGALPAHLSGFYDLVMKDNGDQIAFNKDKKFSLEKINQGLETKIDRRNKEKRFFYFANTSIPLFVSYIPSVVGFFVGDIFFNSELGFFYMARLFGLVFFVLSGYKILRHVAEEYKDVFFVSMLLPMTLFIGSMITADTVSFVIVFAATAFFLTKRLKKETITKDSMWPYILIACLLGVVKPVYGVVTLLVFLVPFASSLSTMKNIGIRLMLSGITFVGALGISALSWGIGPFRTDVVINPSLQLMSAIRHPFDFVVLVGENLYNSSSYLFRHVVGVFGWLDTPMPDIAYVLGGLLLLFVVTKNNNGKKFLWKDRVLIFGVIAAVCFVTSLFLFLQWSPAGQWTIEGLQGRYLIPILPLILILLKDLFARERDWSSWVLSAGVIVLLILSIVSVIQRFY